MYANNNSVLTYVPFCLKKLKLVKRLPQETQMSAIKTGN